MRVRRSGGGDLHVPQGVFDSSRMSIRRPDVWLHRRRPEHLRERLLLHVFVRAQGLPMPTRNANLTEELDGVGDKRL